MKHVILISIDDLRFDCIGYQPDKRDLNRYGVLQYLETPTLDRIAERSLCFSQSISACSYTTASHASVLTGLYPPRHGVRALYETKLHKDIYTLAEILKVFGYKTVMATDTKFLFSPLELNRGFDYLFERDDAGLFRFLEEHKGEKIFLFMHFYDVHEPFMYSNAEGADNGDFYDILRTIYEQHGLHFPVSITDSSLLWKSLKEQTGQKIDVLLPLYVRGVSKFDKNRLHSFIEGLEKIKLLDDGLLFIFSDHGEGKANNSYPDVFAHGASVFDSVIRVPLIMHHRDIPPCVTDRLVSLVDIFPTVLELVLEKQPVDLLPYPLSGHTLTSGNDREYVYAERWMVKMGSLHFNLAIATSILWQRAVRSRREKFILFGEPEFFSDADINGMSNQEFLKAVYRKLMCTFEGIDDFMDKLKLLNAGDMSKNAFLEKYGDARYELYDLEHDPAEEKPQSGGLDQEVLNSYKSRIFTVSTPSAETEKLYGSLNRDVTEGIVDAIHLDDHRETLHFVAGSKNLFDEAIGRFQTGNQHIPDEEFFRKSYRIFFGREPLPEEIENLMKLRQEGVPRHVLFSDKIIQAVDFGTVQPGNEKAEHCDAGEKQSRSENGKRIRGLDDEISLKIEEIAGKDQIIHDLTSELARTKSELESVYASKTWRLGRAYARIVDVLNIPKYARRSLDQRASRRKKRERIKQITRLPLEIMLITNFECVYQCSYCFAYKPKDKSEYRQHTAREWEEALFSFYRKYGKCNVILSGGEPFFYNDAVDFVINLTRYHHVQACTNLFMEKDVLKRIAAEANRANLEIPAAFHPEHADMRTFIDKMQVLKEHGIDARASCVLYPQYLDRMEDIKQAFQDASLVIGFYPYIGQYEGRTFPDGYSEEEMAVIRKLPVWHQSSRDSGVQIPRTKGITCYAGVKTVYINPSGEIRRCMPVKEVIGNVFDAEISFLKNPEPCPVEICDCALYWKYHLE
jgi:arylsulfatase A-like enzyme/MoaA/NifB/PqqE/SkfB family radical SAM enzyme